VHPRTWFKPPVANCFANDSYNPVTPMVFVLFLFFLGVLFKIDILINICSLFLSSFWLSGEAVFSKSGDP
jgi:hypothetical protein